MEAGPYSEIAKGTFLIASPDIDAGLFHRAVVLVCEHGNTGSFGLIINKEVHFDLPEEIASAQLLASPHVGVRAGGPIQTNQMMLLHTSSRIADQTMEICPGVFLGGDLNFLHSILAESEPPDIRLCFGYMGWGMGHLEHEFLDGSWYLSPATKADIFATPPSKLWQQLLRRMGGKYATLSMLPEDLSQN